MRRGHPRWRPSQLRVEQQPAVAADRQLLWFASQQSRWLETQDGPGLFGAPPCVTTKACQSRQDVLMAGDAPLALIRRQRALFVIQGQGMDCHCINHPVAQTLDQALPVCLIARGDETNQDAAVAALSLLLWIKCRNSQLNRDAWADAPAAQRACRHPSPAAGARDVLAGAERAG